MFDHLLPHLRSAAQILTSEDAPLQLRLVEAGHELWATMSHPDEWPGDLRDKATLIVDRLLEGGSVQTTVAQMDPSTVRDVAKQVLDLVAAVEAARNEQLYPV